MCGFAAVFYDDPDRVPDARDVEAMRDLLAHRGPDMAGVRVGPGYGLGFRRLSILDLRPEANQPMVAAEAPVWLVFNGEIYNHRALRRELEGRGHRFRTSCDTEVLLQAYLAWGAGCLDRLEGMFAFAIRDERDGTTWIARDHVGIKPLYVMRTAAADGWLVASEAKAFAAWPGTRLELEPAVLAELLAFRAVAGEATAMRGVRALLPGHAARVDAGALRVQRFFDVRATWCPPPPDRTLHEADVMAFDALLGEAVRGELESDVPLGTQLSGGVDSGVVTALAAAGRREPIHAFTVYFRGDAADERPAARQVVARVGARGHEIELDASTFVAQLPALTWHLDAPMNHPNSVAVYGLCAAARADVTVLLTGDGPDELLAGYERHRRTLRAVAIARRTPAAVRQALAALPYPSLQGRASALDDALRHDVDDLLLQSTAFVPPALLRALGVEGDAVGAFRREALARTSGSPLRRMLVLDIETYLEAVLMRQDKMSMAASVETRVPYLERRVIEACGRLPDGVRLHRGQGKWLLRQIAAQRLGRPIDPRERKVGFAVPLREWLQKDPSLRQRLEELRAGRGAVAALLPPKLIAAALLGLRRGQRVGVELAWMLVAIDLFAEALAGAPARVRALSAGRPVAAGRAAAS